MSDVRVLGAGIIGCSAAAFLAEAGADVVVYDPRGIAAGASGRNSGVLQHPLDPVLTDLHRETLAHHRATLDLPADPDGILLLGATSTVGVPDDVSPDLIEDAASVEPVVRPGIPAVRLHTGWAIGPERATRAWAARAEEAGARFRIGGDTPRAERTLLATGAWTDGVTPLWGVTARVDVSARHVLEEAGVEDIVAGASGTLFSLVGGVLGSSFDREAPDADATARTLAERAARFIGRVRVDGARACPRPQTPDGLPLVGRLDATTWVCAGHGPWGISIGPATARVAAEVVLGATERAPAHLDPARFRHGDEGAAASP
jgi:glycine/D-amino acid oxidase-like deaminating enzyme